MVQRWLRKAENDLKAIEYLLPLTDVPTDILCFHCQQAVEKYLKAYLTWMDVRIKKTHDIANILNLCIEKDKDFEELDRIKISQLTLYAVEIRYPVENPEPTIEDAKKLYNITKRVKTFIIEKLNKEGLSV